MKSGVWQSLHRTISVIDPKIRLNPPKDHIPLSSLENLQSVFADIATPSGTHIDALEEAMRLQLGWDAVIIEKPVGSSEAELSRLETIVQKSNSDLRDRIYINESYYASDALAYVIEQIEQRAETITNIEVSLDKDRRADNAAGRFFDENMEAFGIEAPHLVAIAELVGGANIDARSSSSQIFFNPVDRKDQAIAIEGALTNGINIRLHSALGSFHVVDGVPKAGNRTHRKTIVRTNENTYSVEFSPVDSIPLHHARINRSSTTGPTSHEIILEDNHLRKLAGHIHNTTMPPSLRRAVGVDNAIRICRLLLHFKASAHEMAIPNHHVIKEPSHGNNI